MGEISIPSLSLPVLTLQEIPSFTRDDFYTALTQARLSKPPSMDPCAAKVGHLLSFQPLKKMGMTGEGNHWKWSRTSSTLSPESSSLLPLIKFRFVLLPDENPFPPMLLLKTCQGRLLDPIPEACAHWPVLGNQIKAHSLPSPGPPREKQAGGLTKLGLFCPESCTFNGLNISVFCGCLLKKENHYKKKMLNRCIFSSFDSESFFFPPCLLPLLLFPVQRSKFCLRDISLAEHDSAPLVL